LLAKVILVCFRLFARPNGEFYSRMRNRRLRRFREEPLLHSLKHPNSSKQPRVFNKQRAWFVASLNPKNCFAAKSKKRKDTFIFKRERKTFIMRRNRMGWRTFVLYKNSTIKTLGTSCQLKSNNNKLPRARWFFDAAKTRFQKKTAGNCNFCFKLIWEFELIIQWIS
jgi:hypothetical protein